MNLVNVRGNGRQMLEQAQNAASYRDHVGKAWGIAADGRLDRLAILGAAEEGQRLAGICRAAGIEVTQIVDDHPDRRGTIVEGTTVVPVEELNVSAGAPPLVLATHQLLSPMRRVLEQGLERVIPFAALETVAPERFPPHMFYTNWCEELEQHRSEILALYDLFADERSRQVLDRVLDFRVTFNPEAIADVIEPQYYFPEDLIVFGDDEVFVDGGAFDGDTIETFARLTDNRFAGVYAFEPDKATHARLAARFAADDRVTAIPKGLFDRSTELYFDNAGTRGSVIVESADDGIRIDVTSIDEVAAGDPVTYIKLNIEGAELPALDGARRTIEQYRPTLAVAVYHRPADLWEIPRKIKSILPDYDLYLRQHGYGVVETAVYAIAPT
ncbi:MAG: FkbM family methyltransferase [Pseudomonadota bacterium]